MKLRQIRADLHRAKRDRLVAADAFCVAFTSGDSSGVETLATLRIWVGHQERVERLATMLEEAERERSPQSVEEGS